MLHLIESLNPVAIFIVSFCILFIESGFFFGFFLPGDSLIFPLGILSSQGKLDFDAVFFTCILGVILGSTFGYWTGLQMKKYPKLRALQLHFVSTKRQEKIHEFFQRFGPLTMLITRFFPILRSLVSTIAGTAEMNFFIFTFWNVVTATVWVATLLLFGYFTGHTALIAPFIQWIIAACLIGAALTPVWHLVRRARKKKAAE